MRVSIVFPHVGYCTGWRPHLATEVKNGSTYHIAQALTYLYSTARRYTSDVRVFDFNFGSYRENIDEMMEYAPEAVLISSTVNSYDSTKQIAREVKERRPEIRLFIGGPAVSSNYYLRPALLAMDADCEFVVTNRDIFSWAERVFGSNHHYKFQHFEVDNSWIKDTYPENVRDKIRYCVITSVGCTFKCSFCLNPKVYDIGYKDPDIFRREIEHLQEEYAADSVSVADPFFFMREKHAQAIMNVLEETGMKWSQQTTLSTLTNEHLIRMAETQCSSVLIGIENFSTTEIDKPVDVSTFEDRLEFAKSLGISIKPSFISGLLDIRYEQDVGQIEYISKLIKRGLVRNYHIQSNIYTPYIPDSRDRIVDVPFRFWGVMPVTAQDEDHLQQNLKLCDLIYEYIFPETMQRYQEVRAEYVTYLGSVDDIWMHHAPVPEISAREMTRTLTSGKVQIPLMVKNH
jgi:radical SAM superfamily enzyme YgiQ (UPF0313 family)